MGGALSGDFTLVVLLLVGFSGRVQAWNPYVTLHVGVPFDDGSLRVLGDAGQRLQNGLLALLFGH